MYARVISNQQFKVHQGFDLASWELKDAQLGLPNTPKAHRVLKTSTIESFVKTIAAEIGEPPEHVRLWVMVNRQNKTIRPDHPLSNLDMSMHFPPTIPD